MATQDLPRHTSYPNWSVALLPPLALAILFQFVTPYMSVAGFAYALMITGVLVRKRHRALHALLMGTAIGLDLMVVLLLEIQRNAVATAASFTLSPLQQAHIAASSIATLLYFPVLTLGLIRLKNPSAAEALRGWHMKLGILAFIFRSLGFLLMFSMLNRHAA
jgi:hypothetical protein